MMNATTIVSNTPNLEQPSPGSTRIVGYEVPLAPYTYNPSKFK